MPSTDSGKAYHTQCTGLALETVQSRSSDADITLFASCFCPFVQRVWVAFEHFGIPYKYYEVDPYKKPQDLLEVSPKGLVPGLRLNNFSPGRGLNESTVILEYLEDIAANTTKRSLLPPVTNPYARALVRLQCDHVNRSLVPAFYRYLQAQDSEKQITAGHDFLASLKLLTVLLDRAEKDITSTGGSFGEGERRALGLGLGLWIEGNDDLNWTDVMVGPWLFRAALVLKHYRGFAFPAEPKLNRYLQKIVDHPAFKKTCSTEELYIESYERYAFNRPNTSQVADAINSGTTLP